jgi:hypothetical protein
VSLIFLTVEKDCRFPKLLGVLLNLMLQWLDNDSLMFVGDEQLQLVPTKAHLLLCRDLGNTDLRIILKI